MRDFSTGVYWTRRDPAFWLATPTHVLGARDFLPGHVASGSKCRKVLFD